MISLSDISRTVSLVLPVYNEVENLPSLLSSLEGLDFIDEILLVDDGSTDGSTAGLVSTGKLRLLKHPYNIGNGGAVKTGITHAKGEVLILMDADGQHDINDIKKLLAPLDRFDMVVGTRNLKSNAGSLRRLGNIFLNRYASYIAGRKIPDLTSGFRVFYRHRALPFLNLFPKGFSYPSTLTMSMLSAGFFVCFEPISVRKRILGKSKVHFSKDGMRFLIIMTRLSLIFDPMKFFLPASFAFIIPGTYTFIYYHFIDKQFTVSLTLSFGLGLLLLGMAWSILINLIRNAWIRYE